VTSPEADANLTSGRWFNRSRKAFFLKKEAKTFPFGRTRRGSANAK
jgi:hypothetical protein